MPMDVKKLKELPDELCYAYKRADGISEKILAYLIDNQGTAFTVMEIVDELKKQNVKTINDQFPKKTTVHGALAKLAKGKTNQVQKKGSYYYYEKPKEDDDDE